MKKFLCSILIIGFLFACSQEKSEIKTVDQVKVEELMEYKDTSVGSNSAVSSIISSLPGGSTYREFELSNQVVKVIYGLKEGGALTEEEFSDYWLNNDTIKKNFLYNAAAILILIPTAEKVVLEVDSDKFFTFTVSRAELDQYLPNSLVYYDSNEKSWEEQIIKDLVKSETKRAEFFKKFPLTK